MNWEAIITILGTVGGFEGIKWLITWIANRKTLARQEEANTDKVELEADQKRWDLFDKMLLRLEEGILRKDEIIGRKDDVIKEKDKLYGEQTARLRTIQDELLALHKEHTNLKARFVYVDTWKCKIGTCPTRKPPKPQLYGLVYNEEEMPIDHPDEKNP